MKKLLIVVAMLLSLTACKKQTSDQLVQKEPEGKTIPDRQADSIMAKEVAFYDRHDGASNSIWTSAYYVKDVNGNVKIDTVHSTIKNLANMRGGTDNNFYHTCVNYYRGGTPYWSEGMAFETKVYKLQMGNARIKSNWCAFYYQYDVNGQVQTDWVQWGYAVHKNFGLIQGFFVYHIRGPLGYGIVQPTINYINDNVPLVYGDKVRFEIINVPGTTFWRFLRNGQAVMDVDLGVSSAQGEFQVCTESWGNSNFPTQVTVDYIETLTGGAWVRLPQGRAELRPWTCQGTMQLPWLIPTSVIMGGREQATTYPYPWLIWGYESVPVN